MVSNLYDPDFVAKYFDDFGEREWTRLVNTPADEIKLHIHSRYLKQYIEKDSLVLDIGAGAGRFTQIRYREAFLIRWTSPLFAIG